MLLCEKSENNSNTIAEPLRSKPRGRDYPAWKRIWMKIGIGKAYGQLVHTLVT
jgi:hypothetical protein